MQKPLQQQKRQCGNGDDAVIVPPDINQKAKNYEISLELASSAVCYTFTMRVIQIRYN